MTRNIIRNQNVLEPKKPPPFRINLHVFAYDDDSAVVYHVLHIGFFHAASWRDIADNLAIRSIAFHSDITRQTGSVRLCVGHGADDDVTVREEDYEPRRPRDD